MGEDQFITETVTDGWGNTFVTVLQALGSNVPTAAELNDIIDAYRVGEGFTDGQTEFPSTPCSYSHNGNPEYMAQFYHYCQHGLAQHGYYHLNDPEP